jgi:hypothetical protein
VTRPLLRLAAAYGFAAALVERVADAWQPIIAAGGAVLALDGWLTLRGA